jgi:putative radical SAM enzyme (TIGR03279 family)
MKLNINVSVQTTNPELRCKMMNNRFAGEKLVYLKQMTDAGIKLNCQIVLCPGLNDGKELERTFNDLGEMMPNIQSIAVVPVGLSKFRDGLYPLEPFTQKTAVQAIEQIEKFQQKFLKQYKTRLVFPADEFFLTAKREIPDEEYYEDYCQYENGVGMLRSFENEFTNALNNEENNVDNRRISVATGYAAFNLISKLLENAQKKWHNLNYKVYPIKNEFFGETITVTGLITGQDLIKQLKDKDLGEELLISSAMLRHDSDVFLDDITVSDVEHELNVNVRVVNNDGYDFLGAVIGNC